jgi:hypothetical protein
MSSLGQNPLCPGYGDPEIGKVRDDDTGLFPSFRYKGKGVDQCPDNSIFFLIFVLGILFF